MSSEFSVPAERYDRFMGRYTPRLAQSLCDAAGVAAGMRVLDVGCGPGGLATEVARRVGEENVSAVDPSPPFVEACRARHPAADVRAASAEDLPFADDTFDASLASLVVHFMADPLQGVREMARVTRPGGVVAACVWDMDGGMEMLRGFWRAARAVDARSPSESALPGTQAGQLGELFRAAGLAEVEEGTVASAGEYADFDDWWEPFTFGVGPAGVYVASLDDERRSALREACRAELGDPQGPFTLGARAWFARGTPG